MPGIDPTPILSLCAGSLLLPLRLGLGLIHLLLTSQRLAKCLTQVENEELMVE